MPRYLPLLAVSPGIEIGYLAVTTVFPPVLRQLRAEKEFERYGARLICLAIAPAGFTGWFSGPSFHNKLSIRRICLNCSPG
jgi:hypothetical protein